MLEPHDNVLRTDLPDSEFITQRPSEVQPHTRAAQAGELRTGEPGRVGDVDAAYLDRRTQRRDEFERSLKLDLTADRFARSPGNGAAPGRNTDRHIQRGNHDRSDDGEQEKCEQPDQGPAQDFSKRCHGDRYLNGRLDRYGASSKVGISGF